MTRICILPKVSGVGGMVSFRGRFTAGLTSRTIGVSHSLADGPYDSVLVIGGTRDVLGLLRAKRNGFRIVQRLNGMNWLHRKLKTGIKHYLRSEYGNFVLNIIRSRIADHIVYQSEFARSWWEDSQGQVSAPASVVYNAIDLDQYSPGNSERTSRYQMPSDRFRVLLVEGSLMGGYELGLTSAIGLVRQLNAAHRQDLKQSVELVIAGHVSADIQSRFLDSVEFPLVWAGLVPPEQIPGLDASAHLLYSADINPACPNSVIEALACGTPVLAFDTGALPEMVTSDSGRVVPYGGDSWELDPPDMKALTAGAVQILTSQAIFRPGARARAESAFNLDTMVDRYLEALLSN